MGRKLICTIFIALLIFGLVVFSVESGLKPGLLLLGCVLGIGLTFGFLNLNNKFFVFAMVLTLLLIGYLTWKYACWEVIYSFPLGSTVGLLLIWGWVYPHHPFSRSSYVATQTERKEDKSYYE